MQDHINKIFIIKYQIDFFNLEGKKDKLYNFTTFYTENITDETDVYDFVDNELENIALSPFDYNNIFADDMKEHYGNILNWGIIDIFNFNINSILELDELFLPFKTNMFKISIFDDFEVKFEFYKKYFNKKYKGLDFKYLTYDKHFKDLKKSNIFNGFNLILKPNIELVKYILSHNPEILLTLKNIKENSKDIIELNNKNSNSKEIKEVFESFNGNYAFLEGDFHLSEKYNVYINKLKDNKKNYITITDLYNNPDKLEKIIEYNIDNIVISSTGINVDGLNKLIKKFLSLNYIPKKIIFVNGIKLSKNILINTPLEKVEILKF